jgi:hypothetical protein
MDNDENRSLLDDDQNMKSPLIALNVEVEVEY